MGPAWDGPVISEGVAFFGKVWPSLGGRQGGMIRSREGDPVARSL